MDAEKKRAIFELKETLFGTITSDLYPLICSYILRGKEGAGFGDAFGIAVDDSGSIYVSERGCHRIQVFNSDGSFSREFGGLGNGDGQLNYPAALEFNFDGELVVVDRKNHRIQMLDPLTGKCIWKFGTFGRADGLVSEPSGVAIDDDANYIITDSGNNRLQFFTSKGIWFKTFKSDEFPFNWPVCISYSQGRVYICDYNAHRIRVFSWAQGEIKHALTFGDSPNGDYREDLDYCSAAFSFPIGILTDRDGKVFVSDERHIQCFSPEGLYLCKAKFCHPDDKLHHPKALCMDKDGNLYVVDSNHGRFVVFGEEQN